MRNHIMDMLWMVMVALAVVFGAPLSASAQAAAASESVPTRITADKLTYSQERDTVIFEGQVHVVRGEMQIWSDKLTGYLTPKDGAKEGTGPSLAAEDAEIRTVVAVGNVRMLHQGREGFSGKATFVVADGVLTMEDNPVIVDGPNRVVGEVIRFYSKTNRSEVLGGKKRVEAVFFTTGDEFAPARPTPQGQNATSPSPGSAPKAD
ncbi:OstA family protein [Alkalidesulfovibrio alkalitolerans DSM 16529]|jgi:lipopolysaccharide export system protein LptA|uniref:OstA family protein n=1 Tax=Alkalidesulfovibrio alkalitolerans DSM 16529 TaxID=1121439 RepID=S7T287_9BACT|nr:LptA/OstA family protein [Alkalidesulfovibrio alkalitolerans]EPR30696.1 OstA family protein [Alkalidesulfovibrio alkalitolerans DSM 16529]